MIEAVGARHAVLHKDAYAYSAHPHIAQLPGGDWLIVFNRTIRRRVVLHPPQDPEFRNWLMRSSDQGESWSAPQVVPGYDWHGVECSGLTVLGGKRVMINQWRFNWYPLDAAKSRPDSEELKYPASLVRDLALSPELQADRALLGDPESFAPWARGRGITAVHLSADDGRTWPETHKLDTSPHVGGYGIRGALQLPGGALLLPLSDMPNYRSIFIMRSNDDGRSWERAVLTATQPDSEFEEPHMIRLATGRLMMLIRDNGTRHLHSVFSDDEGLNWSPPRKLAIEGYPPHLLTLPDGRILCTYGWRQPDFGIRAVISADGGESWDTGRTIRIRGGLPDRDLGYPCTVMVNDGSLFTVYYGQDGDGVTCLMATRWRL